MPLSKLTELRTSKMCQLDHNEVGLKKKTKPTPKKQGADQWERGGKNLSGLLSFAHRNPARKPKAFTKSYFLSGKVEGQMGRG